MTRSWVYDAMRNVTEWTRDAFPAADVPVFPALGNHESYPHDQVAPSSPMLAYAASLWGRAFGLPDAALRTVRLGGYYEAPVPGRPALRVVALNTVLWYTANNATVGEVDPAGQMAWLGARLAAAEADGARVLLLSHVPPGVDERSGEPHLRARFNAQYVALLRRYAGVLAAQLAGHEHSDSFRVGGPLLAPSLTPWRNHWDPRSLPNNPGVRLFSYDRATGRPLEYRQFYMDLAAPAPAWRDLYNATRAYGGLAPAPDADLARWTLLESDPAAFDRYVAANLVGYPQGAPCRGACRARHLCAIRHLDLDAYAACVG
jgi:sphingomyelin phosphodiesterase acid-like 3